MRSGVGAVDGAASVGTYTSILYFIFGVLNEVQFLIPFFLLFLGFHVFQIFSCKANLLSKLCLRFGKNNSNNSSRVRRGLLLFLFENIVGYCCNGFGPYSFAPGLPFYKTNRAVEESRTAQQCCLQGTLLMSILNFYQYHESVCLCWRIRRV